MRTPSWFLAVQRSKAVFLDRDGVINELVYSAEGDLCESPQTVGECHLLPRVGKAIRLISEAGYRVIIISNQPDIAKGRITQHGFNRIRRHMHQLLKESNAHIDAEYYCFHHPRAALKRYRMNCQCRKPEPGLILRAAKDWGISRKQSFMVGDRPSDIIAGKAAKCKTIWINDMKCEYCTVMRKMGVRPDLIFTTLVEAANYLSKKRLIPKYRKSSSNLRTRV